MARPTRLVTVLAVLFLVGGCTSNDGAADEPTTTAAPVTTEATTTTAAATTTAATTTTSASDFPSGTFVAGGESVEFNEDGTCRWFATNGGWELPCKYAVNGDLYTEMWFDWPSYGPEENFPATYYWTFDGANLTFELWGNDANSSRRASYAQTLVKSE